MTGVTDIVLARNEFARMLRESGADLSLIASFDRLSDSIAGMRQSVSQMRMQRIDKLFAQLPRIVRDLAQDMGKKIADRKSTRLNSSHQCAYRMPSSA